VHPAPCALLCSLPDGVGLEMAALGPSGPVVAGASRSGTERLMEETDAGALPVGRGDAEGGGRGGGAVGKKLCRRRAC